MDEGESSLADTTRTLKRELKLLNRLAKDGSAYGAGPVGDDILKWEAHILGPESSPFEGGVFFLSLKFPSDYPSEPPMVRFKGEMFHPNISRTGGYIALPLLKEKWYNGYRVFAILEAIRELMKTPRTRPGDLVVQPEVAEMFRNDYGLYEASARSWTEAYHM